MLSVPQVFFPPFSTDTRETHLSGSDYPCLKDLGKRTDPEKNWVITPFTFETLIAVTKVSIRLDVYLHGKYFCALLDGKFLREEF